MIDFTSVLKKYGDKNCRDIEQSWLSHSDVNGEQNIKCKTAHADGKDVLTYEAWGQRAWLLEHGSGKKMDDASKNPDLPAYKQSEYWNTERENTEIRSRPRSPKYKDLDNNPHQGSGVGMPHGVDVEESKWHFHRLMHSIEPLHIIKETVTGDTATNRLMEAAVLDEIDKAVGRAMKGGNV